MKNRAALISIALSVALPSPAYAANTRTWISGTGVDQTGCGPIATSCRTLQYAHDQTSAGGEIDVKDSAGYGSVIVTKSISIVGDGSIAGVLASAGGNAITINAGASDKISLRGLTVEGAGVGFNGIVLNSGGFLNIANCTITNFVGTNLNGNGILLLPASGALTATITGTATSDNAWSGIYYYPSVTAKASIGVDRVAATSNSIGILISASNTSGTTTVAISNSLFSANVYDGVEFAGPVVSTIGSSNASNNGRFGIAQSAGATVSSFQNNQLSNNSTSQTFGTILTIAPR